MTTIADLRGNLTWGNVAEALRLSGEQSINGVAQSGVLQMSAWYIALSNLLTIAIREIENRLVGGVRDQAGNLFQSLFNAIQAIPVASGGGGAPTDLSPVLTLLRQLAGDLAAAKGELEQRDTDHFQALSAQIAGGAGADTEAIGRAAREVTGPLDRVADALPDLRVAQAGLLGEFKIPELPPELADLATELLPALVGAGAGAALAGGVGAAGGARLSALLRGAGKAWPWISRFLQEHKTFVGLVVASELMAAFPQAAPLIQSAARFFGEFFIEQLNVLHRPMQEVMGTGAALFFEELEGVLDNMGPVAEGDVLAKSTELIKVAGGLGMSAHILSEIAETSVFSKELGFGQLAAFLVDMAGFQNISKHSYQVQVETALAEPARRRANERFRPHLPVPPIFDQLWVKRRIPFEDARQYYRWQGWSDDLIAHWLDVVHREPRPRELARVFDDADIDAAWALGRLQADGFRDEDAEIMLRGLIHQSRHSVRAKIVAEVLDNHAAGFFAADQVFAALRALQISDDVIELHLTAAAHKRAGDEREQLRKLYEDAASQGQLADADLRTTLAAFGYDARAQEQSAARARVKLGAKLFADERSDVKDAVRRAQSDSIAAWRAAFRRFEVDEEQLRNGLLAAGVRQVEVDAVVSLAVEDRRPAPRLATVLAPDAQVQRALDLEAKRVLELQKKGQIDAATAMSQLMQLGRDEQRARDEVDLVAARLLRPPPDPAKRPVAADVAEIRRVKTDTALAQFRAGQMTDGALLAALQAAGHSPAAAEALVERELTHRRTAQVRDQARADQHAVSDQRRALEDASLIAFRAGDLDAGALLANLVAIGEPLATAQAIVAQERARREASAEKQAARSQATTKRKTEQETEDALREGFRQGLLSEVEYRQALLDLGLDPALVDAELRGETLRTARRTTTRATR